MEPQHSLPLSAPDAERLVESLQSMPVREIGSIRWLAQHRVLEALNQQAHLSAQASTDDFVLAAMLTFSKLPVLIAELVAVEMWRDRLLPALFVQLLLLEGSADQASSSETFSGRCAELALQIYYVLHHEATVVNLLEIFMYHDYAVQALDDTLVDLTDYCMRQTTRLTAATHLFRSVPLASRLEMLTRRVKEMSAAAASAAAAAPSALTPSPSAGQAGPPSPSPADTEAAVAGLSVCLDSAAFGGCGAVGFRRAAALAAGAVAASPVTPTSLPGAAEEAGEEAWLDALLQAAASLLERPALWVSPAASVPRLQSLLRTLRQVCTWRRDVGLSVGVTCVTLLRYVTDVLPSLPLSVQTRVLDTHDLPLALVPLIENPPWVRRLQGAAAASSGNGNGAAADGAAPAPVWVKYVNHAWVAVPSRDLLKLTPLEGQAWLALYNLLCEPEVRKRYALQSHRKGTILRVRKYLNETLLNQLPLLAALQRTLDELSLLAAPEAVDVKQNSLLLETVPEVYERVLREATAAPPDCEGEAERGGNLVRRRGGSAAGNGHGLAAHPKAHSATGTPPRAREVLEVSDAATAVPASGGDAVAPRRLPFHLLQIVKQSAPATPPSSTTAATAGSLLGAGAIGREREGDWSWLQVAGYSLTHALAEDASGDDVSWGAADGGINRRATSSTSAPPTQALQQQRRGLIQEEEPEGQESHYTVKGVLAPSAECYCSRVNCGAPASNRCSRCQGAWYCSRECQVSDWRAHKESCAGGKLQPVAPAPNSNAAVKVQAAAPHPAPMVRTSI